MHLLFLEAMSMIGSKRSKFTIGDKESIESTILVLHQTAPPAVRSLQGCRIVSYWCWLAATAAWRVSLVNLQSLSQWPAEILRPLWSIWHPYSPSTVAKLGFLIPQLYVFCPLAVVKLELLMPRLIFFCRPSIRWNFGAALKRRPPAVRGLQGLSLRHWPIVAPLTL